MTAKPRTTIRGEPRTMGTSRSLSSRPPMNEKPCSSTSKPSGTMMLTPPQNATAVISTSGPSISARRRSMSQPPMTATAFVFPLMRQRPLVLWPLITATCHRRFFFAGAALGSGRRWLGRADRREVDHDGVEVASGPGLEGEPDPLGELVEREAALDHVLPQLGDGPVPVGVGHASCEPSGSSRRQVREVGNRRVRHEEQSARCTTSGLT